MRHVRLHGFAAPFVANLECGLQVAAGFVVSLEAGKLTSQHRGSGMAQALRQFGSSTFSSLRVRNYRLYYIGQIISTSGTWMQSIAQAWLVLNLTHSGTMLGLVTALQYLPILILGPWGGLLADRFPKRKLLILTQTTFGLL